MKKLILSIGVMFSLLHAVPMFAQTETSGRNTVYRATETKLTELKHTKLKVNFNYEKEQMNGEAWITASPYFYEQNELILDAKAMLIHEVALVNNQSKSPLNYTYANDILKVNLDKKYNRNQQYTVYVKYTARPNEVKQNGSAAITDAKGLYFINPRGEEENKPVQIWTQGETESSSVWFPTIDKPNQKTTQEIYMTVPYKFVTLSNGILKSSTKEANGLRTDYWVMDKKHAPYLFFMGVGDYAVVKDKWRNIPVDYYIEKEYEPFAKQIYGNTPEMIEFFSKKLNYDYPWQKYSQISARDYVSGAMENTTAVIHAEDVQQKPGDLIDENRWENTIAHELFHHWFGDLVTTESWSNLTVNESFANYSEYLWLEHKYGKDEADYHIMSDTKNYIHTPTEVKKDLVRFNYDSREDMFDLVSYNKGGRILHMLRNYLGDDAFFASLTDYLKTYEYGTAEAHQLRLSMEKISGKDLNWFFNQWYFGSGHPKLTVKYSYEPVKKEVTVSVNQTQSQYFEFPLAIDVYEGGKVTRHQVWNTAKSKNDFVFKFNQKPDLVNVNADQVLLAEITEDKTLEQYLFQITNAKEFKNRYLAVEAAKEQLSKNPVAVKIISAAFKDPSFRIREFALESIDLTNPQQQKALLADVEKLATADEKTLVQAAAISALAKSKDKKYLPLFEKSMSAVSNAVKSSALFGISEIAPEKLPQLLESVDLSSASDEVRTALIPSIVKTRNAFKITAIADIVAFYPFLGWQDPKLAKPAEEGFNWIMEGDYLEATQKLTKVLNQAKKQIEDNPQAKMMIIQILEKGLAKKMLVLKQNPNNASVSKQVELINKTIQNYKN